MHTSTYRSPPLAEALGAFLRRVRESARLSLKEFAVALDYSPTHLSDVERGQRCVTRPMCDQLSSLLGLDRTELYARAGHLSDEVQEYLGRTPQALGVLELLAAMDASPALVVALCQDLKRDQPRPAAGHAAQGDPVEGFSSISAHETTAAGRGRCSAEPGEALP